MLENYRTFFSGSVKKSKIRKAAVIGRTIHFSMCICMTFVGNNNYSFVTAFFAVRLHVDVYVNCHFWQCLQFYLLGTVSEKMAHLD